MMRTMAGKLTCTLRSDVNICQNVHNMNDHGDSTHSFMRWQKFHP